ncbi:MAG TPA: GNAT family N-acetyltransferase [Pyrinomonadaceae bacterium]|nr:GNAT family N-acetyltransferase [Pyrinomonadaceae bacterium]
MTPAVSTIRRALPEEADTLTQIALDAKRHWGYPESWIQHWQEDLTVSPEFIRDNQVYVFERDGGVRGFYALCVSGTKAELEHMWVTPDSIGTGIGKELFLDAMDRAATLEVREIEISADPNAAGFYERMGASQIGESDASIDGQVRKLPRLRIEPSS